MTPGTRPTIPGASPATPANSALAAAEAAASAINRARWAKARPADSALQAFENDYAPGKPKLTEGGKKEFDQETAAIKAAAEKLKRAKTET